MKSSPLVGLAVVLGLVGCAARGPSPVGAEPTLRLEAREPDLDRMLADSGRRFPVVGDGPRDARKQGNCWRLAPPRAALRAGLRAEDWNARWQALVEARDPGALHLLGSVQGVDLFLRGEAERLVAIRSSRRGMRLCAEWTDEDLPARLRHPLLSATSSAVSSPVSRVDVTGVAAVAALRLNRLDAALLNRTERDRLASLRLPEVELREVPRLERRYWLAVDDKARWVNDPRLPRWLAGQVDRREMARLLTGSADDACFDLRCSGGTGVDSPERIDRPLAGSSRPRILLAYDESDTLAVSIVNRLQAEWGGRDVEIQPLPQTGAEGVEALYREGRVALALIADIPALDDSLIDLELRLQGLGGAIAPLSTTLAGHRRLADSDARERAAASWDRQLVASGRAIPLIRDRRWLAFRRGRLDVESVIAAAWVPRVRAEP